MKRILPFISHMQNGAALSSLASFYIPIIAARSQRGPLPSICKSRLAHLHEHRPTFTSHNDHSTLMGHSLNSLLEVSLKNRLTY